MPKPWGCHNRDLAEGYYVQVREYHPNGTYGVANKFIPHTMSTDCRYDHRPTDPRCDGCKHKVADATPTGVSSASSSTEIPKCPTPS